VWNLYEKIDKDVIEENFRFENYEKVCKQIVSNYDNLNESHKKFCMKLVRNLGCYNYRNDGYNLNKEDCVILYYWIYNLVKQHDIKDSLITPIFYDNYSKLCTYKRKVNCFYYDYYDHFEEPVNMIFLDIFQHNIHIIKKALENPKDQINDNLQKYICKCIHIYNEMHDKYCLSNYDNDQKRKTHVAC
ncbi:hypothetical protein PCYB_008270, partial [Plasmodium cynomolgi strain B]